MLNITKILTRTQKLPYSDKSGHFDTQLNNRKPTSNGGVIFNLAQECWLNEREPV